MSRTISAVRSIALNVAAAIGALSIIVMLICVLLGARPAVVISGSMAPGIPVGALTISKSIPADKVNEGDIVTLNRTEGVGLVTHRVIKTQPGTSADTRTFTLKGDANKYPDTGTYTVAKASRVVATIPFAGSIVLWIQQHIIIVAVALAGLLLLAFTPNRAKDVPDATAGELDEARQRIAQLEAQLTTAAA